MDLMPGINSTADALNVEKIRMNLVAQNIANAYTTKDIDGGPYQRKMIAFESYIDKNSETANPLLKGVRVGAVYEDHSLGKMVYNPQHPDANEEGMVEMPNVDVSREMVDLISSSRAYEANLQVVSAARQMAQKALEIGKA